MREFQDKRSLNSSSDTLFDKNISTANPTKALEPVKEDDNYDKDLIKPKVFAIPDQEPLKVYRAATSKSKEVEVKSMPNFVQYDPVQPASNLLKPHFINVEEKEQTPDEYTRKTNRILFSNIVGLERDAALQGSLEKALIPSKVDDPVKQKTQIHENIEFFVVESCGTEAHTSTVSEAPINKQYETPVIAEPVEYVKSVVKIPVKSSTPVAIPKPVEKLAEPILKSSSFTQPLYLDNRTDESIQRILGFLRTVEQDDVESVEASPTRQMACPPSVQASSSLDGVKQKIMRQQLEIDEKSRSLELFKNEIRKIKEEMRDQAQQLYYPLVFISSKADMKTKIGLQRKEYEGTIKRHLGFIDKLLAEKDQLSLKCESLSEDVKKMEKGFKDKVLPPLIKKCRNMEEHNLKDIKQQRELWQATEKVKRDKWITDKTRVIKDQTVKGLEPEIQRMLAVLNVIC
jgi:hypothetical protein